MSQYTVLTYGGRPLPAIASQTDELESLVDRQMTAGGDYRQDNIAGIADRRIWRFRTAKLTKDQVDAFVNPIRINGYRAEALWIDDFGDQTNTVLAYCTIERIERDARNRRTMTLLFEEARVQ